MRNVPSFSRATVRCLLSATAIMLLAHGQAALAQVQHRIPLFMSASNLNQQGFVRVINLSDRTGTVRVHAIDDSGPALWSHVLFAGREREQSTSTPTIWSAATRRKDCREASATAAATGDWSSRPAWTSRLLRTFVPGTDS